MEVEAIYIRTNNQSISIFRCQVSTIPIQPLLQQKKAHLRWKTWNSYYWERGIIAYAYHNSQKSYMLQSTGLLQRFMCLFFFVVVPLIDVITQNLFECLLNWCALLADIWYANKYNLRIFHRSAPGNHVQRNKNTFGSNTRCRSFWLNNSLRHAFHQPNGLSTTITSSTCSRLPKAGEIRCACVTDPVCFLGVVCVGSFS